MVESFIIATPIRGRRNKLGAESEVRSKERTRPPQRIIESAELKLLCELLSMELNRDAPESFDGRPSPPQRLRSLVSNTGLLLRLLKFRNGPIELLATAERIEIKSPLVYVNR